MHNRDVNCFTRDCKDSPRSYICTDRFDLAVAVLLKRFSSNWNKLTSNPASLRLKYHLACVSYGEYVHMLCELKFL